MGYSKKVTDEIIEKILSKGVRDMPQNPASTGLSIKQIREFYYIPEKQILELVMSVEDGICEVLNGVTNLFEVVSALPDASKDTMGKIYLVPQETNEINNKYLEYLTIEKDGSYTWEKIGLRELNIVYDDALDENSENPVKNKVIALKVNEIVGLLADKVSKNELATINGQSLLNGGNIEIQGGGGKAEVDTELNPESENAIANKVVAEALNGKLDIVKNTTTTKRVYGTDSGNQTTYVVDPWGATANTIPFRDGNGCVKVATPKADYDATNKIYVDTLLEGKVDFDDYAFDNKAGVVRVSTALAYGIEIVTSQSNANAYGCIKIKPPTSATISSRRTSQRNSEAVTLGWADKVVKDVLINPQEITMTEEDQAKARAFLGVSGGLFKYIHNLDFIDANGVLHRATGISKYGTPFTYVQGKGICLGTFNETEHSHIFELGLQPDVLLLTSAFINNISEIVSPPRAEYVRQENADGLERTIYLTKIEDIDLTNISNYYTLVRGV